MRARTGSIVKRKPRRKGATATWWARVTYVDPKTGKRHDLQRRGQSKAHARDLLQALLHDIDATEGQAPRNERKTFAELCDYFEKHYVKAAEYVDGRKGRRRAIAWNSEGSVECPARLFSFMPIALDYSWRCA